VLLKVEDVGGSASRTVHMDLATGHTTITSRGERREF
jgi:hypothetical protein